MFDLRIVSSLEKVLPKRQCSAAEITELSCLSGEKISFQAVFSTDARAAYNFSVTADTDAKINTYIVENVPV